VKQPFALRPIRLEPIFRERVWGRESLGPWFVKGPERGPIGEVWFTCEENRTSQGVALGELLREHPEILGTAVDAGHPCVCPLLLKLLFTRERLSVQVHPGDDYAERQHGSLGKTEAWYVLDAEPPGELAVGFRETISRERMRRAAETGEIEALLDWRKVQAGELIFVPAGTVHAIGAGLTVCEVQENSDITYRLYDYGRGRELHLEDGLAVADLGPHKAQAKRTKISESREELVACQYFRVERLTPKSGMRIEGGLPYYLLLVCVKGSGTIVGEAFAAGDAWLVPAQSERVEIEGADGEWIITYTATEPAPGISAG